MVTPKEKYKSLQERSGNSDYSSDDAKERARRYYEVAKDRVTNGTRRYNQFKRDPVLLSEDARRRAFYDDYLENSGQTANRMYEGTINAYESGKMDDPTAYADAVGRKVRGLKGNRYDDWRGK